VIYQEICKG